LGVRCTPRAYVPGIEECEAYWNLKHVKTSIDQKQVLKNQTHAACVSNFTIGKII